MRKLLFLFLSLTCTVAFAQDIKLKKVSITEDISLKISEDLRPMTQQELSAKFLGGRIPDGAFTDPNAVVDLTVTQSPTFWQEKDVALLKNFYDASIPPLFEKIDFEADTIITINEKQMAHYAFTGTPASDEGRIAEQRYTELLYTLDNGRLIVFSFSCPPYAAQKWKPIVDEIFQTIRFKN